MWADVECWGVSRFERSPVTLPRTEQICGCLGGVRREGRRGPGRGAGSLGGSGCDQRLDGSVCVKHVNSHRLRRSGCVPAHCSHVYRDETENSVSDSAKTMRKMEGVGTGRASVRGPHVGKRLGHGCIRWWRPARLPGRGGAASGQSRPCAQQLGKQLSPFARVLRPRGALLPLLLAGPHISAIHQPCPLRGPPPARASPCLH